MSTLPIAVIGAGPVGLAAAAHLAGRGLPFVVLEAGDRAGSRVREWGHVRLFSPWRYDIEAAAAKLLAGAGWTRPEDDRLPTGAELANEYLGPLAELPDLGPFLRYGARVTAITRDGPDRLRTAGRPGTPFLIRAASGEDVRARAVIDASGTWHTPNALGAAGIPAPGEAAVSAYVSHALPDVLGRDRDRFAARRVLVAGFRPDHAIASELRLDLDPILGATRALAPLIDPDEHSCGTVPPHGVDEPAHPEPGYYAIGVKSCGRAPTFLLATGYEQTRSVVAALDGDWAAARDVRLDLPETGVRTSDPVPAAAAGGGCCS